MTFMRLVGFPLGFQVIRTHRWSQLSPSLPESEALTKIARNKKLDRLETLGTRSSRAVSAVVIESDTLSQDSRL
jgi:hypothetical protein